MKTLKGSWEFSTVSMPEPLNYHSPDSVPTSFTRRFRGSAYTLLLVLIYLFLPCSSLQSQAIRDTIHQGDSIIYLHSPVKATIYSLILPGLGQAYNRQYWAIPIIYVGFAAFGYFVNFNQKEYIKFKQAYAYKTDSDPSNDNLYPDINWLPQQSLEEGMNTYRRWRDLNVIGFIGLYALQVIHANVYANLFYYDISPDLTLHLEPVLVTNEHLPAYAYGIKLNLRF